jgi:hypothetical protein
VWLRTADCGLTAHGRHGARVALARPAATAHRGRFRHGRGRRRARAASSLGGDRVMLSVPGRVGAGGGGGGPDVTEIHEPDPSGKKNMPQYSQPKRNVSHLCYRILST